MAVTKARFGSCGICCSWRRTADAMEVWEGAGPEGQDGASAGRATSWKDLSTSFRLLRVRRQIHCSLRPLR